MKTNQINSAPENSEEEIDVDGKKIEMNIYEFQMNGEKDWICAKTIIEALKLYKILTSIEIDNFEDDDDIVLIPQTEWHEYHIVDSKGILDDITFEEYMQTAEKTHMIASSTF